MAGLPRTMTRGRFGSPPGRREDALVAEWVSGWSDERQDISALIDVVAKGIAQQYCMPLVGHRFRRTPTGGCCNFPHISGSQPIVRGSTSTGGDHIRTPLFRLWPGVPGIIDSMSLLSIAVGGGSFAPSPMSWVPVCSHAVRLVLTRLALLSANLDLWYPSGITWRSARGGILPIGSILPSAPARHGGVWTVSVGFDLFWARSTSSRCPTLM